MFQGDASLFQRLLQRLAVEHDREVQGLREELAKTKNDAEVMHRQLQRQVYVEATPPQFDPAPRLEPVEADKALAWKDAFLLEQDPDSPAQPGWKPFMSTGMPSKEASPSSCGSMARMTQLTSPRSPQQASSHMLGRGFASPRSQVVATGRTPSGPEALSARSGDAPLAPRGHRRSWQANGTRVPFGLQDKGVIGKPQVFRAFGDDGPDVHGEVLLASGGSRATRSERKSFLDSSEFFVDDNAWVEAMAESPAGTERGSCERMDLWKQLLDSVEQRIAEGDVLVCRTADMWQEALSRPSQMKRSSNESGNLNLGQVLQQTIRKKPDNMLERAGTLSLPDTGGGDCVGKVLRRIVLHPTSLKRMLWDVFGAMLLLHDFVMIPMQFFTNGGTSGMPPGYEEFMNTFDLVSASFWSVDICVSFFAGYHAASGFVEMNPCKVALHYLRTYFMLDLVIVSVDWVSLALSQRGTALRLGKTATRSLRIFRLMHFIKLNTQMKDMMSMIHSEYIHAVVNLGKILVIIIFLNHYIACLWFGISRWDPTGVLTWTERYLKESPADPDATPTIGYAYTTSLHWSLTQFTPASMEVFPTNYVERTFNVVVIVMGFVVFSSFVSTITSTFTYIRNLNTERSRQEAAVRAFFQEYKVPVKLVSRVWHFINHHGRPVKPRTRQDQVEAFKLLPTSIKEELQQVAFMPVLYFHPFFREYHNLDPDAVKSIVRCCVKEKSVKPNRELFDDWATDKGMAFVARGSLRYGRPPDEEGKIPSGGITVQEGEWVCEAALWLENVGLDRQMLASSTGCEAVIVSAQQFRANAQAHPESMGFLAMYASLFSDSFNGKQLGSASAEEGGDGGPDVAEEDVLFNDPGLIQDLLDKSLNATFPKKIKWSGARGSGRKSVRGTTVSE